MATPSLDVTTHALDHRRSLSRRSSRRAVVTACLVSAVIKRRAFAALHILDVSTIEASSTLSRRSVRRNPVPVIKSTEHAQGHVHHVPALGHWAVTVSRASSSRAHRRPHDQIVERSFLRIVYSSISAIRSPSTRLLVEVSQRSHHWAVIATAQPEVSEVKIRASAVSRLKATEPPSIEQGRDHVSAIELARASTDLSLSGRNAERSS